MMKKCGRPRKYPECKKLIYPTNMELKIEKDGTWYIFPRDKPSLWQRIKLWFKR